MKLKPGIKVGEYPPKLKELVIQRTRKEHSDYDLSFILEKMPNHLFILDSTPEGADWWWKVVDGIEFEWEEDEQEGFPEKWYIAVNKENAKILSDWRTAGGAVDDGYLSNSSNSHLGIWNSIPPTGYTEISMEQFRKHVLKQYPLIPKECVQNKFQIGDYVKYKDGYCEGEAYIVKRREDEYKGSYLVETGNSKWAYYDRNGKDSSSGTCRWFREENLVKTTWEEKEQLAAKRRITTGSVGIMDMMESIAKEVKPGRDKAFSSSVVWESEAPGSGKTWSTDVCGTSALGQRGIWHQLQDEKSTYQPLTVDRLTEAIRDMFYGREKTEGVEKLPKEILIKTKKKKRRVLL